jgi:hypothetical protein
VTAQWIAEAGTCCPRSLAARATSAKRSYSCAEVVVVAVALGATAVAVLVTVVVTVFQYVDVLKADDMRVLGISPMPGWRVVRANIDMMKMTGDCVWEEENLEVEKCS